MLGKKTGFEKFQEDIQKIIKQYNSGTPQGEVSCAKMAAFRLNDFSDSSYETEFYNEALPDKDRIDFWKKAARYSLDELLKVSSEAKTYEGFISFQQEGYETFLSNSKNKIDERIAIVAANSMQLDALEYLIKENNETAFRQAALVSPTRERTLTVLNRLNVTDHEAAVPVMLDITEANADNPEIFDHGVELLMNRNDGAGLKAAIQLAEEKGFSYTLLSHMLEKRAEFASETLECVKSLNLDQAIHTLALRLTQPATLLAQYATWTAEEVQENRAVISTYDQAYLPKSVMFPVQNGLGEVFDSIQDEYSKHQENKAKETARHAKAFSQIEDLHTRNLNGLDIAAE